MLALHPAFQGLIAVAAFVAITVGLWVALARSGSDPEASGRADGPADRA